MILGFEHSVAVSVTVKAVGVGYLLGFLYSFFMLLNSLWNKYSLSVFFRDVLFFCVSAVMCFLFILKYNAGIFRFYIFAGLVMGFLIFYIFPGNIMGKYFRKYGERLKSRGRRMRSSAENFIKKKAKQRTEKIKKKREKASAKSKMKEKTKKRNSRFGTKNRIKYKNKEKTHKKISLLNKKTEKNL